jgi:hypothetical protein
MATTKIPAEFLSINAISGTLIADNAITTVHIAQNAITSVQIPNNSIGTVQIALNTVTSTHIAQNQITTIQLANNSVQTLNIADDQVTADKLAAAAVVTASIVDLNVTEAKIAANAITASKIPDGSITATQLGANSVTLAKMASLARGSILLGNSAADVSALAIGSNGYVLKSDGTDAAWAVDATVAALTTEQVQDITGAMFSSNTETGIAATYQDGDGTVDLVIGANVIVAGMIAQNSILTRHIDDDQVTGAQLADALTVVTSVTSPLIDGENFKVNGGQGSDGQVLTSTGSGVAWEAAGGGVDGISSAADATAIKILSDEKVGIGTGGDDPQRPLQVGKYGTGNGEIAIASVDSGVGSILFGDSASGAALYDGYLQYDHATRCMLIAAAGTDLVRYGAGAGTTLSGLLQITNYGNVGIGRTPQYYGSNKYVDMMAGANGTMVLQLIGHNGSGGKLNLAAGTAYSSIITENNGPLAFGCNQTEYMRLDNTGEFLINRTDGFGTGGAAALFVTGRSDAGIYVTGSNSSGYTFMSFHNGGLNQIGSIKNSNNNATLFNTSSDYRLKENVDYTWDATTRLKQLKPARFNWISDDANTVVDGFMAHEVSSIVPEAIEGTKDATEAVTNVVLNAEGNVVKAGVTESEWQAGKLEVLYTQAEYDNGDIGENSSIVGDVKTARRFDTDTTWAANHTKNVYQSIDHSKLVPLLVKTIQELEARITALES